MNRTAEPHSLGNGAEWELGIYVAGLSLISGLAMPSAGLVALPLLRTVPSRLVGRRDGESLVLQQPARSEVIQEALLLLPGTQRGCPISEAA